jgi:hypothetical protein
MQTIPIRFLLALCIGLPIPAAMAQGIVAPDREQRKSMSYEEYSKYRENMRLQMEKIKPKEAKQKADSSGNSPEQSLPSPRDSAYGQGYHSRPSSVDRPDTGAGNRPERPGPERFNRGDMGRR